MENRQERQPFFQQLRSSQPMPRDMKTTIGIGITLGTISEAVTVKNIVLGRPFAAIVTGAISLINFGVAEVNYRSYKRRIQRNNQNILYPPSA